MLHLTRKGKEKGYITFEDALAARLVIHLNAIDIPEKVKVLIIHHSLGRCILFDKNDRGCMSVTNIFLTKQL